MKVMKYGHACVRLEYDNHVLVVDPGLWSEPAALNDADAILVTHEHLDHIDVDRLKNLDVPVFAPVGAAIDELEAIPISPGEVFSAAGFRVHAVGGRHASIYGSEPDCANVGYIVNDSLYHPGDALFVPDEAIDTLLVPIFGPWVKTCEAIDFVRAVLPRRVVAIHDGQLNERGIDSVGRWIAGQTEAEYLWLASAETA
jgi:L-ascorbate metabolism protein UlaG (beta-lactamase superfamily)